MAGWQWVYVQYALPLSSDDALRRTDPPTIGERRVSDMTPASTEEPDLPPGQITVSNTFAERVGPEGVQRWAQLIQSVVHDSHGLAPDEVEAMMHERLEPQGLAGPPVEMRMLSEIIAAHPGNEVAFVDGQNKPLFGPEPKPGISAHLEPEDSNRPKYS